MQAPNVEEVNLSFCCHEVSFNKCLPIRCQKNPNFM